MDISQNIHPLISRGMEFFILHTASVLLLHGALGTAGSDGVSVSVKEGDSMTLYTGVKKTQQERIKWYFNDTCVAQINGDPSKICADNQCHDDNERFRDRLKLDHQTGSLTIMNIRITDSGLYKSQISSGSEQLFSVSATGVSAAELDDVKRKSVKKGESVTLDSGVIKKPNDVMTWYFNDICITEITGGNICTVEQSEEQNSELKDRLKLDHVTGSLSITNIRTTDAGFYHLQISNSGSSFSISSIRSFSLSVIGLFGVKTEGESVSVMEGDSFTLNTDVEKSQHNTIKWYFNDTRIAQINGDLNRIFADDQYVERFRDRLKLDHQTGSLTITNTRTTDCGVYKLQIINSRISEKIFSVSVCGIPVNETHSMKRKSVKEGESVTLDPGAIRHPNDFMTWYFNDSCIAEITGDLSKICTDEQCEHADGQFRNRLKVNHQTGSLTITNTRNTDSGLYKLEINCSSSSSIRRHHTSSISISSFRSFSVAVIGEC
ncbi:titin-like isoform X2 [Megalobrama amblycephala]|uniref:titin-like isoform X2 n=1 Tax=Megalobrama amblycephala TaxID=75352 RepID=UPI0020141C94|nr:titin-like isoform X2 [Megalobrama amblycephala]